MHLLTRVRRVLRVAEGHKAETAKLSRLAVGRKIDVLDLAKAPKVVAHILLVDAEWDAADEDLAPIGVTRIIGRHCCKVRSQSTAGQGEGHEMEAEKKIVWVVRVWLRCEEARVLGVDRSACAL